MARGLPRFSPRTLAICVALLVLGVGSGTFAIARGGGSGGLIHACIEKGTLGEGNDNLEFHLRRGRHCPAGWGSLSWHRRGPRGPRGGRGPKGDRGRRGLRGRAGGAGTHDALGSGGTNDNPPSPEGNKVMETVQITTSRPGKVYAEVSADASACDETGCANTSGTGLFVDGRPVPHTAISVNFEGFSPVYAAGVIANVPAGTHKVDFATQTDSPSRVATQHGMINALGIGG